MRAKPAYQKYDCRLRMSSVMVLVSRQRGDADAVAMWEYVWKIVDKLGHGGMSDDEDDEDEIQQEDGHFRTTPILKTLRSMWRHPYFLSLFQQLDKLPGVEAAIFRLNGKKRIVRQRVDKVSGRPPPPNLPRSFFDNEFLHGYPAYRLHELKISAESFVLHKVRFEAED